MADPTYTPKVYRRQGGSVQVVASGGKLLVENGGQVHRNLTPTNITTVGAETYSAAQIATGLITRDPNGAARTDTTDTAVAIIAALDLEADGDCFELVLINTADAAEAITIAGGTNVTIANAGQTIAQNESARLIFRRASSTTMTVYIVGA